MAAWMFEQKLIVPGTSPESTRWLEIEARSELRQREEGGAIQ
jgi:hypothetical protein